MAEEAPPRVIAEFPKNARESVRASLKTYQGRTYGDIRLHYWAKPDGGEEQLAPTRKGLTLRLELLPELKRAVDLLVEAAEGAR